MRYYCWLDVESRELTASWDETEHEKAKSNGLLNHSLKVADYSGFKLIEYKCLNDPSFRLHHFITLV